MAELPGKPCTSTKQFTIQNKPQSYAPVNINDHYIASAAGRAQPELRKGDKAWVIIYIYRYTNLVLQKFN